MTYTQTQQFTATSGFGSVTWSVDGVVGGTPSTGTITVAGLYTPPQSIGAHTVAAMTTQQQSANATVYVSNYAGTFTYHNDNLRTGQNNNETVLSAANVNKLASESFSPFRSTVSRSHRRCMFRVSIYRVRAFIMSCMSQLSTTVSMPLTLTD